MRLPGGSRRSIRHCWPRCRKLEFLVVIDFYAGTPLGELADVVLPMAMSMEKDGTFTIFDRTVQRLRAAVPPMGEAKNGIDIISRLASRMGYGMTYRGPAQVCDEIAKLVPGYGGVTYARLERNGVHVPVDLVHRRRHADFSRRPPTARPS